MSEKDSGSVLRPLLVADEFHTSQAS